MSDQPAQPIIPGSIPTVENELPTDAIPSCSVCGRQDETLRLASLPFVFSIIVVTFRRAMVGLWCQRHRNLRLALAGSITSIFGWVGIPFGLVYTPVALLSLARGGNVPVEPNLRMLKRLAEHKLRQGDIKGAVRCFEEALKLSDDEETLRRLREVYRKYSLTLAGKERRTVLPLLFLLVGAPIIGACVGLFDHLIAGLFNFVGGQEVSIFLAILSWIPLVVGTYIAGIALSNVLTWALARYRLRKQPLGIALAVVVAGFAAYGLPEGRIMAEYLSALLSGPLFESLGETVQATGAILTRGGVWLVRDAISNWGTAGIIYVLILLAAFTYFVVSGLAIVRSLALQQQRIETAKPTSTVMIAPADAPGWLTLTSALTGFGLFIALFFNVPELQRMSYDASQHAELGEQLYLQGDFEGAAIELEQASRIDPENGLIHSNLGWAYLQQGRYSEAKREFQDAINLDELSAETYLGLGYAHLALEEFEAALPPLMQAIEANPTDELLAQAYFASAVVSEASGDSDQAILYLEEAVRLDPREIEFQINLAWARFHNADYIGALQGFQDVLRLEPDSVDAALGHAFVQLELKNYEEAKAEFEALIEMNVDSLRLPEMYIGLSLVYEALYDLSSAAEYLELSLGLSPQPQPRIKLMYLLVEMGEFDKALDQCDMLIADQPDWAAPVALKAWVYFTMGQTQVAGLTLEGALSLEGEDLESVVAVGLAYVAARRFSEAEEMLLTAVELTPNDESLMLALAYVYSVQFKYDEALNTIEELLMKDEESVEAHIALASLFLDREEIDRGLEEYLSALELGPEEEAVHSGLSYTYFHLGQIENALAEARETIRLNEYAATGYKNLAFALHAQGNFELALEAAQEALRLAPTYDTSHYILGVCYMEMGENEKAAEAFERFLTFYIDRGFIREYKAQAEAFLEELQ